MKHIQGILLSLSLLAASVPASAVDIVACVVADELFGNATYFGMATTVTRLKCEFTNKDFYPTMSDLYRQGKT